MSMVRADTRAWTTQDWAYLYGKSLPNCLTGEETAWRLIYPSLIVIEHGWFIIAAFRRSGACLLRIRHFSGTILFGAQGEDDRTGRGTIWRKGWFPWSQRGEALGKGLLMDPVSSCKWPIQKRNRRAMSGTSLPNSSKTRMMKRPRLKMLSKHLQLSPIIAGSQMSPLAWKR